MQHCLEHPSGPDVALTVPIPAMAQIVVETYWSQVRPYGEAGMLRQNEQARDGVHTIPDTVRDLRLLASHRGLTSAAQLRAAEHKTWEKVLRRVALKVAQLPLFHLQKTGGREPGVPFLYEDSWLKNVTVSELERRSWGLDLFPGIAHALGRVSSLLQPVVHRWWVEDVQRLNAHELNAPDLHGFLFGAERTAVAHLAEPLRDLQDNRCFYCERPLPRSVHVDHVLPWSRVAIDGLSNLVVTDPVCNGDKSATLPAVHHVAAALGRPAGDLLTIAAGRRWPVEAERVSRTARGLYGTAPVGTPLWRARGVYDLLPVEPLVTF